MLTSFALSLRDLLGSDYIDSVCLASANLGIDSHASLQALADEKVEFFPTDLQQRLDAFIPYIGKPFTTPLADSAKGAGTAAFDQALHRHAAPLTGLGCYRLGEDGRLAVIGKSEHYQASLGHNFPGYRLLDNAHRLGITNITHNNTRGHITRLLEQELIRIANGLPRGDADALNAVLASREPHVLNRVINLETGSLVCEAAFKMMLARFYRLQPSFPAPKYAGKTPVFLVMADFKDGKEANYHGTTIMTQLLRGMWPDLYQLMEANGLMKVVPVKINDKDAFAKAVATYDTGKYKVAGFLHELVLMNYAAIRLDNSYVDTCHALCDEHDIPILVDEIQSCLWSPELFLFKEYKCHPDFVSVGKGFPGGNYPAAKVLTTADMDTLNQFGALVTNGQEELASLANLITMRFAEENASHTAMLGKHWQAGIRALQNRYPNFISGTNGDGLLSSIFFHKADDAVAFCHRLGDDYAIDISVQTYKADCPPAALSKFPLVSSPALLDAALAAMDRTLAAMA